MEETYANSRASGETKQPFPFHLIGAILFLLLALQRLVTLIQPLFKYGFSVYRIYPMLFLVGSVVVAVSLLLRRKDELLLAGLGILTGAALALFLFSLTGSFLYILANFINLLGYLSAFGVALICQTHIADAYKPQVQKLWFVPSVCIAAQVIVRIMLRLSAAIFGGVIYRVGFVGHIAAAAAILFTLLWLLAPKLNLAQHAETPEPQNRTSAAVYPVETDGYCSLGKHVLLLLFTFGIWNCIWIYRTTKFLNQVEDEEMRNPATKLLLCMFVPFYSIYWTYKSAQRIDKLAEAKGLDSDLSTICLILAFFVAAIPPILMQDKINALCTVKNTPAQAQRTAVSAQASNGVPEELKKFKNLLDDGVITQEEFDKKKAQLLDL